MIFDIVLQRAQVKEVTYVTPESKMAITYRRVASNENNDDATGATRFESNIPATTTRSRSERISDKVYACE